MNTLSLIHNFDAFKKIIPKLNEIGCYFTHTKKKKKKRVTQPTLGIGLQQPNNYLFSGLKLFDIHNAS